MHYKQLDETDIFFGSCLIFKKKEGLPVYGSAFKKACHTIVL